MNRQAMRIETINSAMSLRLPQYQSLQILDEIMRSVDLTESTEALQQRVHDKYPIFREFEWSFPSLTFALATGVGKTMLMGAFITYLYTNYDMKHFFIIAPNLTIYNKLIRDFGEPSYKKYVFKRIQPFVQNPPTVITGDTYQQYVAGQRSLWESITINIFNIGKINAEVRSDMSPQVKRLSEYIGQSYFEYLAGLPDLVVLMDESHHYRADRGMAVINELNPLLGLELTATPQVETSKGAVKFRNVVYEYSLARAITDGYVKEPAAATRRTFDTSRYSLGEIDRIKLADGVRIHRNTQAELTAYAENADVRAVKPFVLVVCKDTAHAAEIKEYLASDEFYDGYYADKVIEVHSNQRGGEKDENVQKLLGLESPDNPIEIVVHVNMLKEGWDVTNLYTIIPLRTATSLTLREQTIGRGLRLPYGERTGNAAVDRLTLVAHDKFDEIIKAASEESSIIRRENIIVIEDDDDMGREKEVVKSNSVFDSYIEQQEKKLQYARSDERKQAITDEIRTTKAVGDAINEVLTKPVNIVVPLAPKQAETVGSDKQPASAPSPQVVNKVITTRDLTKPEVQEAIRKLAKEKLSDDDGQIVIVPADIDKKIEQAMAPLVEQKIRFTIDIPDVALISKGTQLMTYRDFDLNTQWGFSFAVPNEEIVIESLHDNTVDTIESDSGMILADSPENLVLSEILNLDSMIDYDEAAELLYKLIGQAFAFTGKDMSENNLHKTVSHNKREIARLIWMQLKENMILSEPELEIKLLRSVSPILQQDYTKFKEDEIVRYTANIPAYEIKKKVVGFFESACHDKYKFDSVPEHVFSIVLERDKNRVEKWLRPASHQFKIWWSPGRAYEPDFVVETTDYIYIVEIKAYNRVDDDEVKLKAKAACAYCEHVNTLFAGTGRKPWRYMLLEDRAITRSTSFEVLEQDSMRYGQ